MKKHTLDATGKKLGRLASEAAHILRGKNTPAYAPHILSDNTVHIENASKLALDEAALASKKGYTIYSGHPGGLKNKTMKQVAAEKGYREVLRLAILRMLPRNTLRPRMMKHLTIDE